MIPVRLALGHVVAGSIGGVNPYAHEPARGRVTKHLVGAAPVLLGPAALPVAPDVPTDHQGDGDDDHDDDPGVHVAAPTTTAVP